MSKLAVQTGPCGFCGGPVRFIWNRWCHTDIRDIGNHQGVEPNEVAADWCCVEHWIAGTKNTSEV